MFKRLLTLIAASTFAAGAAQAATVNIGSFTFDDSQAADVVTLVNGRAGSVLNPYLVGDRVDAAEGWDLSTNVELTGNNNSIGDSILHQDVLQVEFTTLFLVNNAGYDILIFEVFNQNDPMTAGFSMASVLDDPDAALHATLLEVVNVPEGRFGVYGIDLSDLGFAPGEAKQMPLFISRDEGSPDIAAIVAYNATPIPLPAAAPLFFAGIAGLAFARLRRRRAVV